MSSDSEPTPRRSKLSLARMIMRRWAPENSSTREKAGTLPRSPADLRSQVRRRCRDAFDRAVIGIPLRSKDGCTAQLTGHGPHPDLRPPSPRHIAIVDMSGPPVATSFWWAAWGHVSAGDGAQEHG